jgi:hypothetical protein
MTIKAFREVPKNLVEWGRFFAQAQVVADEVPPDAIQDKAITLEKIQDIAPDRLLGRDTSPAGTVQELTVSGGLEFTGSGIQRSALSGDVTAAAGSSTTTFRDGAARSVLGRSAATSGAMADIVAGTDGHYLRRSGGSVGFGAISDADLPSTIARDSEVSSAISAAITVALADITSGTYTPSLTNISNLDSSTAYVCQRFRLGLIGFVSGAVDVNATAAGDTRLGISFPIASNLSAAIECAGSGTSSDVQQSVAIFGDAVNNRAEMRWQAVDGSTHTVWFMFMYQIIP